MGFATILRVNVHIFPKQFCIRFSIPCEQMEERHPFSINRRCGCVVAHPSVAHPSVSLASEMSA